MFITTGQNKPVKLMIILSMFLFFKANAQKNEPPKIGNFALASSQQIGPMISLGQNILEANEKQAYLLIDHFSGQNKYTDIVPGVLFGVTNTFSIFLNIPFAASYKKNNMYSSGLEDMFLQLEYAYHTKNTSQFTEQATLLASFSFPSGSTEKQPSTGVGAISYLLGTTYSRTYCNWYSFISSGTLLTNSNNQTKIGNQYFYQFGFGRNFNFKTTSWIFSSLIEIDGQYSEKDKIQGQIDNNSGGNIVNVTPSLWFSTKKFILQLGIGFPIIQHLFGEQNKNQFFLMTNLGYTF